MNRYDCDTVRDLVPLQLRGQLPPHEAAAVEEHVLVCDDCAAEAALVRTLAAALPAVPAGLEARVLMAIRRPVPVRRFAPWHVAAAATVAAAVLGGVLVLERNGRDVAPDVLPPAVAFEEVPAPAISWVAADDPFLRTGMVLQEMSVEELEVVLMELES
jgi:anti-sigma factor RsiW